MQTITSTIELKDAIRRLEYKQATQGKLLKEQFDLARERLEPLSLIRNTFKEVVTSPNLIGNILSAFIGLGAGYVSKKVVVGLSGNLLNKLFGSLLQIGVTSIIAKNPEEVISIGQRILQRIFAKKETNT